jgi:hypothetical protein
MELIKFQASPRPQKRFLAIFRDKEGAVKKIHFSVRKERKACQLLLLTAPVKKREMHIARDTARPLRRQISKLCRYSGLRLRSGGTASRTPRGRGVDHPSALRTPVETSAGGNETRGERLVRPIPRRRAERRWARTVEVLLALSSGTRDSRPYDHVCRAWASRESWEPPPN